MTEEIQAKRLSQIMKQDYIQKVNKYYSLIDSGLSVYTVSVRFGIAENRIEEFLNDANHFYNTRTVLIEKASPKITYTYLTKTYFN